jgi:sugar (pentulose or hexulose) kinase
MLLGIDLGTTALKIAAYAPKSGRMLHGVEKRLTVETDSEGRREQSPMAVIRAIRSAIRQLGKALGGLDKVTGVALAAQGGSTIIADRETGAAHTPMILWNDSRSFPAFQELSGSKPARYWRTRTLRDEPGMGLARIAWLRAREPELLCADNIYVGAGEYVYHQLTGVWRQDACNALQIGCYDARTQSLSKELAALADVSPDFFAPLRQGHAIHPVSNEGAKCFGLPEGVPVAGPYMDHEAGYLAASHVSTRPLQFSLGTAWVGNFVLPEASKGAAPFQFSVPAPHDSGQLVIMPLLTGNVTWDWALSTLVDGKAKRALVKQRAIFEEKLLPPDGLVALPWLNRPNVLHPELLGGACYLGMGPSTTREDLLRAVVAGMCYELARVFAEVQATGCVDSVVLSGGASRGIQFQQLISQLFSDLPVYQIEDETWMGTRGALHAFSARVAKAKVRRIRSRKSLDWDSLSRGNACYLDAFERLYGKVTAGRAYSVRMKSAR